MTCKLEQALETVEALIKKLGKHNSLLDLQRIEFEIKAKMNAKSRMLSAETNKPEFDKLPTYAPEQNNMTYAGVGSRETPPEILEEMTKIAHELANKGYSLNSGGAIGADMAFEGKKYPKTLTAGSYDVTDKKGEVVIKANQSINIGTKEYTKAYYVFRDKNLGGGILASNWSQDKVVPNTSSFSGFDVKNNKFGNAEIVKKIANEIHPSKKPLTGFAEELMARNTYQIFGKNLDKPVDFVLFYAKETGGIRPEGGTGQAIEMARLKGIPTINMADGNWKDQLDNIVKGKSGKVESKYKNQIQVIKSSGLALGDINKKINTLIDESKGNLNYNVNSSNTREAVWYGSKPYEYTGASLASTEKTPGVILKLADRAAALAGEKPGYFNSVLINRYKDNKGLPPHRDNEKIFKDKDGIVGKIGTMSISGSATINIRKFRDSKILESADINAGDFYVMPAGKFQDDYTHEVITIGNDPRVSLTFRHIPSKNENEIKNKPIKVYHGTNVQIDKFDSSFSGGAKDAKLGHYFTSSFKNAVYYGVLKRYPELADNFEAQDDIIADIMKNPANNKHGIYIIEAELDVGNHLVEDYKGKNKQFTDKEAKEREENLQKYDTLIQKNIKDGVEISDVFLVKDSNKITIINTHGKILSKNATDVVTTNTENASDFLDAQQDFVDEQYAIGGSKEYIEMIDAIQDRINEGRKLIDDGKPTDKFIEQFKKDLKAVSDKRKELLAKFFDVDIPKMNSTELIENGVKIEGLKPQQAEAAVKLQNMLNSKVDNTFILEGEAGTGKSYTVSKVLAKYIEDNKGDVITVAAATAHKAKDVIGDMIDEVLQEVGKNDIIELEPVTRVVDLKLPSMLMDVKDTKVVVLDEVSMVSPSTMADIKHALEFARSKGVNHKVIMLGDRAQLRPVVSGLSVTDKDRVAFKDNKSGFYMFKKDMYDFGIPGTYDAKKGLFIPNDRYREDAILPAKLNTDGSITIDAGSMLLKSFIFRSLDDVPESLRHKLDEQQRNKTKTFEAIRKFRTDKIETELAAENSKSYREQFTEAVNGLTAVGAVRLDGKTSIPTKVMNDIKHGRGVFLSYVNAKVDSANTLFTNIFAKESGIKENLDTASKYGVFAGQRVFSVSNITIGTTRVTNNTQGSVDSIEDIGKVNSNFVLYDTDRAYRLAKEKFPHMWNFGSMYKTIDPSVTIALNTTAMVSDGVDILTAIGINIRNKDGGNSRLVDIMLNDTSKKAIVDYVNSNAAKFSMYDMFINKNETAYNRALSKFFIKYGTVKMEVVTKDTHEVEITSLDNVLVKTYNGVQQTSYAKDIVNNFMGIAAPYAQTVHKSQGSTFDSIISDEYTNSYQTMVNKMELLYVALSRSRGDIVLAPDILNNLAKTEFNTVSEEIDGYLNSTGEVDTKPEDSIINTEKNVTKNDELLNDMIECKNSGGF